MAARLIDGKAIAADIREEIKSGVASLVAEHGRAPGLDVDTRYGLGGTLVLGFTGFVRPWHRLERALEVIAALPGKRSAAREYRFRYGAVQPRLSHERAESSCRGPASQLGRLPLGHSRTST